MNGAALESLCLKPGDFANIVDEAFENHPGKTGQLIGVLNYVQDRCRYLPEEAIPLIAERMNVPVEQIMRMGEFFSYLSLDPVGVCVVDICDGTACHSQGAARLVEEFEKALGVKEGQTTEDGLVTLRTVGCVGACGVAPVVVASDDAYGRVRVTQVPALAKQVKAHAQEKASSTRAFEIEQGGELA